MVMNFIAPKLSVEIVVGQGLWYVYTELTEVSNNIHYPALWTKLLVQSARQSRCVSLVVNLCYYFSHCHCFHKARTYA